MNSFVLENCSIAKAGGLVVENVLIENGVIKEITSKKIPSKKTIDCHESFLLPGAIDCHVHFRSPGFEEKEGWISGSMAAASGGVTTVLDMPNTNPPTISADALELKRQIAQKSALVNFGFHFGATESNLREIGQALRIASIKIFIGKSTGGLFLGEREKIRKVFGMAKKKNFAVCVHAEDQKIIEKNERRYRDSTDLMNHSKIRTALAESEAIEMVLGIQKTEGNRLHICHVSSKEGVKLLREAKESQPGVTCEATPHHLLLTEKDLPRLHNFGEVNPAIKSERDRAALWSGIRDGTIDCVASDHAPHLVSEKHQEYWSAPAGMPGVETLLPIMVDAAASKKISFEKLISLTSRSPAKIFGIKNKGELKNGFDADIALFGLEKTRTVSNKKLFTKCGWSAFDSLKLKGTLEKTIIGGEIVFGGGIFNKTFRGKEVF